MKPRTEKDRISAVLFIVVFLLVVVIVIMVLKTVDDNRAKQVEVIDPTTGQTQPQDNPNSLVVGTEPVPTPNPYAPASSLPTAPTTAPVYNPSNPGVATTPTPAQTNPGTQQPSDTPYVSKSLGSGTFTSNSGAWLNTHLDWSAVTISDSQVEVTVSLYLDHQSLQSGPHNGVTFLLGEDSFSENAPAIRYDSNEPKSTLLSSHTFTVDLAPGETKTLNLSGDWHYGGSYGGPNGRVKLDVIKCGGLITLAR